MANHKYFDASGREVELIPRGLGIRKDAGESALDNGVISTGFTQESGLFMVGYADNVAFFILTNQGGTPTTALLAGSGTYFSITKTTDTKVNVYWETDQLKVENKLGATTTIYVSPVTLLDL